MYRVYSIVNQSEPTVVVGSFSLVQMTAVQYFDASAVAIVADDV